MRKLKLFTFLLALLASVGMMNAATAIYSGFTATAGCGGFSGEDHAKLVDGKFTSGSEGSNWTKWCADSQHKSTPSGESQSCHWVEFNSANPITATGYILTTGNDNTTHGTGRNPKNWVIKAKLNANDAWTTIANVSNDNTLEVANFKDFSFNLSQAGTYKYFRFMVTSVKSGTCMQLCELRFEMNGERLQVTGDRLRYEADAHYGSLKAPIVLKPIDERPYKVLENNHVVIIRNGERYDVTGKHLNPSK